MHDQARLRVALEKLTVDVTMSFCRQSTTRIADSGQTDRWDGSGS